LARFSFYFDRISVSDNFFAEISAEDYINERSAGKESLPCKAFLKRFNAQIYPRRRQNVQRKVVSVKVYEMLLILCWVGKNLVSLFF